MQGGVEASVILREAHRVSQTLWEHSKLKRRKTLRQGFEAMKADVDNLEQFLKMSLSYLKPSIIFKKIILLAQKENL